MSSRFLKCVLALTVLPAATAYASNVRSDYDHKVSFANYRTLSWGRINTSYPLNEYRAKADIQKDLESKGWRLISSGGAAKVVVLDKVHNEKELETMYDGMDGGWGGGWAGKAGPDLVEALDRGALEIQLRSRLSELAMW